MSQFPEIAKTLRSRYQLIKILGSGGFGDTYLAKDIDLPGHPQCVVKHLHPKSLNLAVLPVAKSLFEKEAQILYRLGKLSSQIPQLFAHFKENGEFYLVQEFIDGHDLSEEIIPGLPKTENAVFKLLKDILEVLAFVHQHNIIHRDVKPQNLMRRREDGKIVLIDFGAVKEISTLFVNANGQASLTAAVGSPGYMPSEQANGRPKLCSDVYAVGMIGIQSLTGLLPHQLPENSRTGEVIWRDKAQVSERFASILDKMVRDHFSQRYQSAQEVLQALVPTVLHPQSQHSQTKPQSQPPQPQPQPKLPSWKVLSGLGIGLGIVAFAVINVQKVFTSLPTETAPIENVSPSTETAPIENISPLPSSATSTLPKSPLLTANIPINTVSLNGAGASFPAPLYTTWFTEYNKQYPNLQFNYQSIGSGGGVERFIKETIDFGASDVAMRDEEIARVQRGVILLPMTAGGIVLAYNLPNIRELRLPRQVYIDIFLGKIKSWNDPAIARVNPGVSLPSVPITVVYRSDGSGTTGLFTRYLSAISPQWQSKVGEGKYVNWITGVGSKGNEGVVAQIQQTQGAIGYVEYGYAVQYNMNMAALENKAGQFVKPTPNSLSKTLDAVSLPDNLRIFITDPEGTDSYPIVTYTWLLVYKKYDDPNKAAALKTFLNWSLTEGQKSTAGLGYAPLPPKIVDKVQTAVNQIL